MLVVASTQESIVADLDEPGQQILDVFRLRGLGAHAFIRLDDFDKSLVWENGGISDGRVRRALVDLFDNGYLAEMVSAVEVTEKGEQHIYGGDRRRMRTRIS